MNRLKIVIITGYAGSGKSTAVSVFEDAGFYCVDNMPVALLENFLQLSTESSLDATGFAFVMDLREKGFLTLYPEIFESIKKQKYDLKVLFLEAEDEIILQRYSQTRRHHPLSRGRSLLEAVGMEREQLKNMRKTADRVIDTSRYNVHDLRAVIRDIAQKNETFLPMKIDVLSFGFKYGVPFEADLIMDVRFLPSPHFETTLKVLDGTAEAIKNYVLDREETRIFLKKYLDLIDYLIPLYQKEGKSYLTLAVGCTGGRHRSVVIACYVFEHLKRPDLQVTITHRNIEQ
ncbi:MAG: RNase adapter RapZ [Desulfobacterales bacterium]|nr:RNase adapter RapZ [Desulfobacterales bacterium]